MDQVRNEKGELVYVQFVAKGESFRERDHIFGRFYKFVMLNTGNPLWLVKSIVRQIESVPEDKWKAMIEQAKQTQAAKQAEQIKRNPNPGPEPKRVVPKGK
jgi:hypothetical protein